jgi:glutamyl-tRNA synthetase
VQKSAATFDPDKLLWVNAQYIHHGDPRRLASLLPSFLDRIGLAGAAKGVSDDWMQRLVKALQERSRTLVEMAEAAAPYLHDSVVLEDAAARKFLTPAIQPALTRLKDRLATASDFSPGTLEGIFKEVLNEHGLKMGQLAQPVRVALTGRAASPGIFEVMDLLGRDRTLRRLQAGIERATAGVS